MNLKSANNSTSPVTVVVSRRPKQGYEDELGNWIRDVLEVASTFPGHLGIDVVAPDPPRTHDYVMIFRWAAKEDFDRWHASPEREEWVRRADGKSEEPVVQTISGIEPWFSLAGSSAGYSAAPPRWKMAIVTFVVIWLLASALAIATERLTADLDLLLRTAFTSAVLVPVLTWLVMPRVTRLLSGWLYRR